jgi:hypothetical protein
MDDRAIIRWPTLDHARAADTDQTALRGEAHAYTRCGDV